MARPANDLEEIWDEEDYPEEDSDLQEVALPRSARKNRRPKKRKSANKKSEEISRRLEREVIGVILIAIGSFFLLALISYHPNDPSWNAVGSPFQKGFSTHNWTGAMGAHLSDLLLQVFGISSFVVPFGLLTFGGLLFGERLPKLNWKHFLGLFLLTIITSALLRLQGASVSLFGNTYYSGGIIGDFISYFVLKLFNRPGAYIILGGGFLATFIAITQFSIISTSKLFLFASKHGVFSLGKGFKSLSLFGLDSSNKFGRALMNTFRKNQAKNFEHLTEPKIGIKTKVIHDHATGYQNKNSISNQNTDGPKIITREIIITDNKQPKLQGQLTFKRIDQEYKLPSAQLLKMEIDKPEPIDEKTLRMNSKILEKKLLDYGVKGRVLEIHPGPVITMYEFEPAPGVKVKNIVNLTDDLSMSMGGRLVRILAPIPGKAVVGIEIPNHLREIVTLHDVIHEGEFFEAKGLTLALGKDIEGGPKLTNLTKMPHLLIAGATGTGKSVAINSMICSLLLKFTPDQVRFLMIDPKMVELASYEGIPHLLLPVITDPKKASVALKWAVSEMEQRLKLLSEAGTRNIDNYNRKMSKKAKDEPTINAIQVEEDDSGPSKPKPITNRVDQLPYIVIILDELADLMIVAGRDIEESITRLAQMARAVGIHLIIATQRPSVDVITGVIKANLPTRISFKVFSRIDSRTILDCMGAESLLGDGDMLFLPPGTSQLTRIHGAYITEIEVEKIVTYLKKQGNPDYNEEILEHADEEGSKAEMDEEVDELFDKAVDIVLTSGKASVSYVQRRLSIGYNRAARIVEMMEMQGIVGPADGSKAREILAPRAYNDKMIG